MTRHEGLSWSVWKTLEWTTGMCLLSECHVLLTGHQFPRQPHSSLLKWQTTGVLPRRRGSLKDQSGTPKINEKSWSLSFSCDRLWAGHPNLDQSIKWSLDISLTTSACFFSALYSPGTWKYHRKSTQGPPSFNTLNVCLLLNWCRKPKRLKSSRGNVDCGNPRVFSHGRPGPVDSKSPIKSLEVNVIKMTGLATWTWWPPCFQSLNVSTHQRLTDEHLMKCFGWLKTVD